MQAIDNPDEREIQFRPLVQADKRVRSSCRDKLAAHCSASNSFFQRVAGQIADVDARLGVPYCRLLVARRHGNEEVAAYGEAVNAVPMVQLGDDGQVFASGVLHKVEETSRLCAGDERMCIDDVHDVDGYLHRDGREHLKDASVAVRAQAKGD